MLAFDPKLVRCLVKLAKTYPVWWRLSVVEHRRWMDVRHLVGTHRFVLAAILSIHVCNVLAADSNLVDEPGKNDLAENFGLDLVGWIHVRINSDIGPWIMELDQPCELAPQLADVMHCLWPEEMLCAKRV